MLRYLYNHFLCSTPPVSSWNWLRMNGCRALIMITSIITKTQLSRPKARSAVALHGPLEKSTVPPLTHIWSTKKIFFGSCSNYDQYDELYSKIILSPRSIWTIFFRSRFIWHFCILSWFFLSNPIFTYKLHLLEFQHLEKFWNMSTQKKNLCNCLQDLHWHN